MSDTPINTNPLWVNNRINAYLQLLGGEKPVRYKGRRTEANVKERLATCHAALGSNHISPLERLLLVQKRMDLSAILEGAAPEQDGRVELEEIFVKVAPIYGERHGISYKAWREVGVPAPVLKRAGIA